VYDPTIGRFLQADVVVRAPPGQILSYNRYGYVWNNPKGYTDPSGYFRGCPADDGDIGASPVDDGTKDSSPNPARAKGDGNSNEGDANLNKEMGQEASGNGVVISPDAQKDAFGSATAKSVGTGVTAADLASVEGDLKTIAGTKRGAVLFSNIKSRGGIDVEVCRGCGKLVYDPRADKIIIDLNISPSVMTASGKIPATTLRILAHELGHAGTWTTNVTTRMRDTDHSSLPAGNRMLNSINNENALMNELGQPSRTQY